VDFREIWEIGRLCTIEGLITSGGLLVWCSGVIAKALDCGQEVAG